MAVKRAASKNMAPPALSSVLLPICHGHHAVRAGGASWEHPTKGRYPSSPERDSGVSVHEDTFHDLLNGRWASSSLPFGPLGEEYRA